MPLRLQLGWGMGNTVPYGFKKRRRTKLMPARTNYGFLDLRGRPDLAATIVEAGTSPGLAAMLRDLSSAASPLFSLGCDIGSFQQPDGCDGPRHATGGYVQVLAADYGAWGVEDYKALAGRIAPAVEARVGADDWELDLFLQEVRFNLDGHGDMLVSLAIHFNVWAHKTEMARLSRERLIAAIGSGLLLPGAPP